LFAIFKKKEVVTIVPMGSINWDQQHSSSKGAVITLSELLAEEYKEKVFRFFGFGCSADRNVRRSFSGNAGSCKENGGLHFDHIDRK
jgi:hypothetical protein